MILLKHTLPGVIITLLLMCGCKSKDIVTIPDAEVLNRYLNLPATPFSYASQLSPSHFASPPQLALVNTPAANPVTNAGATLGRVLFYDKTLSINNTISCASCHVQANGFSDPAKFSKGFNGGFTPRNSMSVANAKFYQNGRFFWDERAATLEAQVLIPIQDPVEMGLTLAQLTERVAQQEYYKILFRQAFGSETVSPEKISLALSQFMRAIVTSNSKYDTALQQASNPPNLPPSPIQPLPGLSPLENLGKAIFFDPARGNCGSCHGTQLFVGAAPANNGLEAPLTDRGLGAVNSRPIDDGKFKMPSLRNIALTAPYMHDGRHATLLDVINHYNNGVVNHPNLDQRLKIPGTNTPRRLNLTTSEKEAIIAFLHTLTDPQTGSSEWFASPFK